MSNDASAPSAWDPTAPAEPTKRGLLGEFWVFLWANWLWWVTPTVLILASIGFLVYSASNDEGNVAPFIYSLF